MFIFATPLLFGNTLVCSLLVHVWSRLYHVLCKCVQLVTSGAQGEKGC